MASQVKGLLELKDSTAYLVAALGKEKNKQYALLELPVDEFSRYIELPSEDEDRTIIWLDDVIRICLPYIFAGFDQISSHLFSIKISRDAEMNFYNDIKDNVLERVHQGVIDRYKGLPVQLTYDKSMPLNMLKYLIANLGLTSSSLLFPAGRYLNFKDLMCFPINDRSDLMYEKWDIPGKTPFESSESIIKTVQQRDVYLHCPYHSFSYYIRMLRDASVDPDVQAIKTTVYRLASNSKIVKALINAARNGKKVTVVVELLARFDESSNINWAQKMEEAGIKVIFGVEGLKIHSKLTYIKHKEKDIVCIGTGNFHEGNAGIYTDVFLFTAHKGIAKEVSEVFKFINRPYGNLNFKYLWVSPYQMRKKIYYQIAKEVRNAKQGKLASILVKINHLTDYGVITRLYNAADKGVNIRLIVRGNCSIVSNKNIEVVSIVDRYLEHSRIFIFANGGEELCYISSADWMTRNLDHRIEVAAPIFDPQIHNDLKYIIECGLKDNVKARITDDTQKNKFKVRKKNEEPFQSQFELYKFHSGLRQLTENEWRTLSV